LEILLVLGLFNIINLNIASHTIAFGISYSSSEVNTFGIQPWFLLATLVYIAINWRMVTHLLVGDSGCADEEDSE
jgi:hypothetical protein